MYVSYSLEEVSFTSEISAKSIFDTGIRVTATNASILSTNNLTTVCDDDNSGKIPSKWKIKFVSFT